MSEIQKADPNARRTGLLIIGVGTVLGVALITTAGELRSDLEDWVKEDPKVRLRMVMAALMLLTMGPVLGLAVYFWRLGERIVRAERYPPPGFRVVRDTTVVIGQAAGRRGRLMQVFAAVTAVAGLLVAFFLWRLFFLLKAGAA